MLHLTYVLSWLAESSFKELVPRHMKLQLNDITLVIANTNKFMQCISSVFVSVIKALMSCKC